MSIENLSGLIANVGLIDHKQAEKLFAYMIGLFEARNKLNKCLRDLDDREWRILLKAVNVVHTGKKRIKKEITMPCNSDYLAPTRREIELRRAAQLYKYALSKLGQPIPRWLEAHVEDSYLNSNRSVPLLCELLTNLSENTRNNLVYNARDKTARDLADWWEEHQEADRAREEQERFEKAKE